MVEVVLVDFGLPQCDIPEFFVHARLDAANVRLVPETTKDPHPRKGGGFVMVRRC